MKAVVLAAGRGVRLKPFTLTRPKHLLPVGGVPLLERTLIGLRDLDIEEILIVTHYMEEKIRGHFGDGSTLGLRLVYTRQERMMGTADAFRQAQNFAGSEEFLGIYGDLYVSPGCLVAVVKAHVEGETTMAVVPVEDPSKYGVVELEGDRVTGIIEKPAPGSELSKYINAGIYIFTPDVFDWIRKTGLSKRREYEVTDSIKMITETGSPVRAVKLPIETWLDVGLPWDLLDANERTLASMEATVEGKSEQGARIHGPVRIGRGTRVRSSSYIEGPVVIGEDCDIGPNCYIRPGTSIGSDVRVGNACEVKNSIVMDGTHIAHLSYVGDSIIGEGCNLGAGTITANIRFNERYIKVNVENRRLDSGRRKLGALIGDSVQTGINVNLMPGIKVGPGAWIAPGLTVYEDVPAETFLSSSRAELKTRRTP
jgi:bifunctional UDP-N-acetylglucosamine pyrophosphorylase/glucosamine-1-phosphate N-acetyltransferase